MSTGDIPGSSKGMKKTTALAIIGALAVALSGTAYHDYSEGFDIVTDQGTYRLPDDAGILSEAVETLNDYIAQLEAAKASLIEDMNTCNGDKTKLEQTIKSLQSQIDECNNAYAEASSTAGDRYDEIETLKTQLAEANEKYKQAVGCCSDKGAAIIECKSQVETLEAQIRQLQNTIAQLQATANPQLMDTTDSWLLGYSYFCIRSELEKLKYEDGKFAITIDGKKMYCEDSLPIAWIIMPQSFTKTKTHYDETSEVEYWVVEFDLHVIWAKTGEAWCSLCCCQEDFHVKICAHLSVVCGYSVIPYVGNAMDPDSAGQWTDPVMLVEVIAPQNCCPETENPGPFTQCLCE